MGRHPSKERPTSSLAAAAWPLGEGRDGRMRRGSRVEAGAFGQFSTCDARGGVDTSHTVVGTRRKDIVQHVIRIIRTHT